MREIKFRGIAIDGSGWIFGFLFTGNKCINGTLSTHCYIGTLDDYKEVDPETVGQYTGITNKKDKEIYEGDIVKIPDNWDVYGTMAGEIREIYFGYGGFRLKPKYKKDARGNWLEDADELEIIGNIHDNPELIGE